MSLDHFQFADMSSMMMVVVMMVRMMMRRRTMLMLMMKITFFNAGQNISPHMGHIPFTIY